jgi:competence protein ComEA
MRAVPIRFFLRSLPKSQWLAISLAATVLFGTLLWQWWKRQQTQPVPIAPAVVVEVRGDVRHPGVFMLDAPVSVMRALTAAGGCLCGRDGGIQASINKQPVFTGQRLEVTCPDQDSVRIKIAGMDTAARLTLGLKLDLNAASPADLALLPGMRPHWTQAIVERRSREAWRELSELREIPGIGPRTVEKWADYLEVHETAQPP